MNENLSNKVTEVKPLIRSILLALGRRANEKEFRREYFNNEGESFNNFLLGFQMNFFQFMRTIPDVCRVWKINTIEGEETQIERVSTEESSHLDALTIVKNKKKKPMPRFSNFSGYPPTRFNSSMTTRQPYASSSTFFRNSSTNLLKPKISTTVSKPPPPALTKKPIVQPKISARPVYSSSSLAKLPLAPHQTMKPVVYRANKIEENEKENIKPNENALTALPLHLTMKPIVFKGIKEESRCKEDNVAPTPSVTSPSVNDTGDSELWSDEDEELATKYRTQMAGVKPPKTSTKVASPAPVIYNSILVNNRDSKVFCEIKPRETNPFKIQQTAEMKSKPVIVIPQESKTEAPLPSIPKKIASNTFRISCSAFEEIAKQKIEDIKRLNEKDRNNNEDLAADLEDYHTVPFVIPGTRMRKMPNQIFFEVELVEFTSPSQFMFQYNQNTLEILTEEMDFHYKNLDDSKHLSIQLALHGMPVAVLYDGSWQRAEVISVNDSDAFLHFVDAGCKKHVKISNLRYLEKTFAASPRNCYKGSLFGVKPTNGESLWSAGAIMKFMSKTKGVKLYATIKEQTDGFYQLSLVDDIVKRTRVSDHMVTSGFAEAVMDLDYSKNWILI